MLERFLHGLLGDLVEGNAAHQNIAAFFAVDVLFKLFRQMGGNGLTFAVRVRRQINGGRGFGHLLQFGQDFFLARNNDVFRAEIALNIHAQLALGQIFHMSQGSLDLIVGPQVFIDGFRLGRRFNDDK